MGELTNILFSPVNITLSVLLIVLIVYWIFNMITGIDFDTDIDVDIDIDVDAEIEIDMDADTGIEGGNIDLHDVANTDIDKEDVLGKKRKSLKWWQVALIYFNFVGLPFMFTFTCWIFIWWILTVISTTLTHSYDNTLGFIFFFGGIIPSLFINKVFTTPFKNFFKSLNPDGDKPIELIGRIASLKSSIEQDQLELAEVTIDSKVMSIYVKSLDGSLIDHKNDILIIKQSADKNYYYVKSYSNN